MFDFRILKTQDGVEVFDFSLKTPYNALDPEEMLDYTQAEEFLYRLDLLKRRKSRKHRSWFSRLADAIFACIS